MSSEIVFIETEYFLRSATSLQQFINIKCDRIITLIGEHHMDEFSCGSEKKELSISEYVIRRYNENKQIYICLEYFIDKDPSTIASVPIKEISKYFKDNPSPRSPIIPYDNRAWWIEYRYQLKLYGNDKEISSLDYKKLKDIYIEPMEKKHEEGFLLFEEEYEKDDLKTLLDYVKSTRLFFKTIQTEMDKENVPKIGRGSIKTIKLRKKNKVVKMLRVGWQRVTDFYLLKEILKKNDSEEIIVIAGEAHIKNVSELLNAITFRLEYSENGKSENDCVRVFIPIKTTDVDHTYNKSSQHIYSPITDKHMISNFEEILEYMKEDHEFCGYIKQVDGKIKAVVSGSAIVGEGGRPACVFSTPYENILWHTHPNSSKAYPSAEDILKVLKKRTHNDFEKSFIYTKWGVWEISAANKKHIPQTGENEEYYKNKINNEISRDMYEKTKKGRASTLTFTMQKSVEDYIKKLETTFESFGLIITLTQWDKV
jgi:hypothetical protein